MKTKTYRKLFLYKIDSEVEQPIATFDNPMMIPIEGSIIGFSKKGLIDIQKLETCPPKTEQLLVLSVHPAQDNDVESFFVSVMNLPTEFH